MRTRLLLIFVALVFQANAQNLTAQFAKWKNNAKAVYTLTHDDYSSFYFDGIQAYADTVAYNRGVKFTFGVITSTCDADDWTVARRLISHGHEVMCHTHTHSCSHAAAGCVNGVWSSYANELDQSTNLIFNHTASYPRFFIWPYDVFDQSSKDYLKNNLHYYGGRGGASDETLDVAQLNDRSISNFFDVNFSILSTTTDLSELNALIDLAISNGKWGVREVHGVEDASYAAIPLADYRNHCDYIKSKVDAGLLWNANASDVTTYLMQARAFVPTVTFEPQNNRIKISWNNPVLDVSDLRSPVTLNIQLDGLRGYNYAYQNTEGLEFVDHGDSVAVNCFPHKGDVYLYNYDRSPVNNPFTFDQYQTFVRQGDQSVVYSISEHDADEYVWSYSDAATIVHSSGHQATLDFGLGSGNGKVSVYVVKNGIPSFPKSIDVTVLAVNDVTYACPVPSQVTFSITNQNNKKYLWLDAPEGGNALAFASSLNRTNLTAADTFYIARQDDSVLINVPLTNANISLTPVAAITARKITLQQELIFRTITFGVKQVGPQTVDIYQADGQTKVFSVTKSFDASYLYTLVTIPLQVTLPAGEYYIKVNAPAFSNYAQTVPLQFAGIMTLDAGGYGVAGDGSINFSDAKTASQSIQIGLTAVKPAVVYPGRVAVYMTPLAFAGPSSYTGALTVCAGSTRAYAIPAISGFTNVYRYSDDQFDTTITSVNASIHFKNRASNGTLSMYYKNACGQLSDVLVVPIVVAKPALSNFSGPATIDYPGNATFNFTQPAGTSLNWTLSSGKISFVAQSPSFTELKFSSALEPADPSFLYYSLSEGTCSVNYAVPVVFNRVYPNIEIISPAEGEHFTEGDLIELLASVSNTAGEPVLLYYKIVCSDSPSSEYGSVVYQAPYENSLFAIALLGNCTLTAYSTYGKNDQQRTFYIDRVTGTSSAEGYHLMAYPNPTEGKLFVAADWNNGSPIFCTATNNMGQVYVIAYSEQAGQLQFDFGPLANGLYHLRLSSGDKAYSVNVIKFNGQ